MIGLCGGTASGKSWLSRHLKDALGGSCVVVCQDWYYRDNGHLSEAEALKLNFDHPNSIEGGLFLRDLDRLLKGEPIEAPVYDYATHARIAGKSRRVDPAPVVVVEGLFILHEPSLRRRMDLSVYIDVPSDVRLLRRIRRDCQQRRIDLDETLRLYEHCVRPMHERYIGPSAKHATWIWRQTQGDRALPKRILVEVRRRLRAAK